MLRIRVLGDFRIEGSKGDAVPLPESARARSLLAWLAVHPGLHSRSRLAGVLRPDATEASARKTVRDAVWAIRKALGEEEQALRTERERLGLGPDVDIDLGALRRALREGRLEEAEELAAGELLPGMDDDWVVSARAELNHDLDGLLASLAAEAASRDEHETAVRLSRRRAALDPLAEEPIRELIRRLAAAGDRGRALSAYEEFADRLRRELQTVPSGETRDLIATIRKGDSSTQSTAAPAPAPTPAPAARVTPTGSAALPAREIHYAHSDGASIAYTVVGEGPIDLVFVPGFVSHIEVFWEEPIAAQVLGRLASFSRVVLWDRREQGLSDRGGRAPTLEQGEDDLLTVMDAAGVERASIFGVSEGGPLSLLFAASHPHRVDRLVLYGTHARLLEDQDYPEGLRRSAVEHTVDQLVEGWGGAPCLDLWAPSRIDDPAFVAWWSRLLRSGTSPGAVREVMKINFEIDVREVLSAVGAATLVIHASGDRLVPSRLGSYLADHLPDGRLVLLPGSDHIPFNEHAGELLEEVEEFLTGRRPEAAPDRILTTILFVDVAGSTERAARVGDRRWRADLESYHAIVREQVERFRGRLVSSAGDGFLASFDGPARAVRCAQRIVAESDVRGIGVRAGVHTGECELVDGDLAGIVVHIGARIAAAAEPTEVLVSSTVRDLVVGSDLRFAPRGEHELKGLPGRWALLAAEG